MIYLDARKQFDGPVHNLLLRGVRTQLLRGLLGHIAKANQQGIQSFGDLAVLQGMPSRNLEWGLLLDASILRRTSFRLTI